ncbi:MAG: hypothetical protein CML63_11135 [Rhodobacteraceae bacterium]|nr:hypothetical protein [Paracoccaceae bacterium]|tara:strand:- start:412 stop:771 length:360 start_codon:yes stop_codon:yes gene_type:complete
MTSTRNKNTKGNYNLEQKGYSLARDYDSYKHSQYGQAHKTTMPDIIYRPSFLPRDMLSSNPIEIESTLFGINSTNLVKERAPTKPQLKTLPTSKFFERVPLIMPKQLVIEKNQRPLPMS